jgi:hypothetical protein
VQHGHGPGDRDLLVVDLVRFDDGAGGVVRDPELQERSTFADAAEPVLDRLGIARGVDDEIPTAEPVELVGGCGVGRAVARRSGLTSTTSTLTAPVRLASSSIISPIVPAP